MAKSAVSEEAKWIARLTGDIYDASLDPSRWPNALEGSCAFLHGMAASLASFDFRHADLNLAKLGHMSAATSNRLIRGARQAQNLETRLSTRKMSKKSFERLSLIVYRRWLPLRGALAVPNLLCLQSSPRR